MKFVTSFNPYGRIDRQKYCLETWKKYGLPIIAVQHKTETDAEAIFSGVDQWVYVNGHNPYFDTHFPDIRALINECDPGIIINSDISVKLDVESFHQYYARLLPHTLTVGIRLDRREDGHKTINPYGIDLYLITADMHEHLQTPWYTVGNPGWDYWIVLKLHDAKYEIKTHKTGLIHEIHNDRWEPWKLTIAQGLLQREFGLSQKQVTAKVQRLTKRAK